jgi:hypothetical protein
MMNWSSSIMIKTEHLILVGVFQFINSASQGRSRIILWKIYG